MGLFGIKSKAEKTAEQNTAELEALKAAEEGKLAERYNIVMPKVKRYLDSIGFELSPDENIFFMQIDENTDRWKYVYTGNSKYEAAIKNENYICEWNGFGKFNAQQNCKYIIQEKVLQEDYASGILLTSDGKAYIGALTDKTFFWCTDSGDGLENCNNLLIHNVLAVGDIKNQLLCGCHISDLVNSDQDDIAYVKVGKNTLEYTNSVQKSDFYWCTYFPKSVKRIFILPSDEFQKKNTVVLGASFCPCSNLRLFYSGFDKCVHEKLISKNTTYKVFSDDTHATFISPSEDSLEFFNAEGSCKNWEFKVGTTIQNAVSPEEAAKQESENIRAALEANAMAEVNTKLSEKKEELSKLEATLAAKKAEVSSLGMDAQAIVKKAALNKEIKELEPKVEALKAEIEKLSK